MGHKKKNKGGGSGQRRKKGTPKDHVSFDNEDYQIITEEITALSSIYQEDLNVVSESPPHITIKLRPYSKDMGYEDPDVCALLLVRYLPGYPYKCPKLLITPEKGMSESDAKNLLSLIRDQAITNSREGMVMIYNLVEAAKEFLSEIIPAVHADNDNNGRLGQNYSADFNKKSTSPRGPFVYGFVDLFSGSGESWHWGIGINDTDTSLKEYKKQKKDDKIVNLPKSPEKKQGSSLTSSFRLHTAEESNEDVQNGIDVAFTGGSTSEESVTGHPEGEAEHLVGDGDGDSLYSLTKSLSSASLAIDDSSQTTQKDLLMVHLLRLACTSSRQFADALPQISTELYNLGIFSEWVRDLASKPFSDFSKIFEHVFRQNMVSSKLPHFWQATSDLSASFHGSRYLNDFEELKSLGHGGFGHVVLCKNKLDGRQYAVKKIRLKDGRQPINDRILREVATLSRLQHQHVVRYYQAWFETGVASLSEETPLGSRTAASSSLFSFKGASSADALGGDNKHESTYLYIQMEYCPRTLRHDFESYNFDKEFAWHLFRQIVEGMAHIHGQGIIHRDLTPSNIFFDARNEIKIGDFGLAKFLKLEHLDQDASFPMDTTGISFEGTGQVGTYFYTAPEIEQGWPKIDEKADMYSLGVVFFELWHPFGTAMERHIVLSDLKQKGEIPSSWASEFPEQASLLQQLLSPSPSDRPSAVELLQHAFPPRMESELLDNILRTMHSTEDSTIYDKVVNAIFDEEMISIKNLHSGVVTSSIQYTDVDTERRDYVAEVAKEVFKRHCAKHLEIVPMHLSNNGHQVNRNTVKLLTSGGDIIEVCHELRLPFVNWVVANQKSSFKRYEMSYVYRRAIGHSSPNRYLQADFDIIGGASALTEAEVIKAVMDIIKHIFNSEMCDIHVNHGELIDAIWYWIGIKADHRHKVAELLSMMSSLRPGSAERKSKWVVIRRQLLQELNLEEAVVNKLQTVGLRFCGAAELVLPRLRGALPANKHTHKALHDLSELYSHLRVWRLEKHVYLDALMPPTEIYHRDLFFQMYSTKEHNPGSLSTQMYSTKEHNPGSLSEGALLAVGGRYDYLVHQLYDQESKTNISGAVGTSLALETIIQLSPTEFRPVRTEAYSSILVCSRGGGGLLEQRMELVAELWEVNIKAEFVPIADPSLTEQYEYANEHDIKCLVILTDVALCRGFVKVHNLELKKNKDVSRLEIVRFLQDALSKQLKIPYMWI